MGCPARRVSPSHAKISSTRPPERGPTCTSSTSIVPETELFCLPQDGNRIENASNTVPQKRLPIFGRTDKCMRLAFIAFFGNGIVRSCTGSLVNSALQCSHYFNVTKLLTRSRDFGLSGSANFRRGVVDRRVIGNNVAIFNRCEACRGKCIAPREDHGGVVK